MNGASSGSTDEPGSKGAGSVAPPPDPADVGLVAALGIEVQPFLSRLKNVRKFASERHTVVEGECEGKVVVAILAGPGRPAARRAAELLMAGHRPHWILSAGFAGALTPEMPRGALVLPREILDPDGQALRVDVAIPEGSHAGNLRSGRLLTVDHIVRTAAEKRELHARHGADLVDMETSAVAALCSERGVRFLSFRVVSDDADTDLPPEVLSILGPTGSYRVGAALAAVWKRPSSVKELWALREAAIVASDRLCDALPGVIAQLP